MNDFEPKDELIQNGYSVCLNQWALDQDIKTELGLLNIISSLTAERGYCFATNEYFAKLFKCDAALISRKIAKLKKHGYITIDYKKRGYEIVGRYIRLTKMITDDCRKRQPTIDENVKYNNINMNNINMNNIILSEAQNSSSDTASYVGTQYDTEKDILFVDEGVEIVSSDITKYKLILNTKASAYITTKYYKYLKDLYPAVNIDQEFKLMEAWCYNNKTKRKTKSGIKQFINKWLSKSQNTGNNAKYQSNNKVQSDYEKRRQLRTEDVIESLSKSTPESFEFKDFDI